MYTISFNTIDDHQLAGASGGADTVEVTVLDASGNPAVGQVVTFNANNGSTFLTNPLTTNSSGQVTVSVSCDLAGDVTLIATLADNTTASTIISFDSDATDPGSDPVPPLSISFTAMTSNQLAGSTADIVLVSVVDSTGAVAANQAITWSVDTGATFPTTPNPSYTNSSGEATVYVFSDVAGDVTLTATLADGTTASTVVTFIDKPDTPPVTDPVLPLSISLTPLIDNQLAGGTADVVIAKVVDASGAAISGQSVTFSVDSGATFPTTPNPSTTDSLGEATVYIFSTSVADVTLTAALSDGTSASLVVTFTSQDEQESAELEAFKADVVTFTDYVQQQLDTVGKNVGSALSQLSASVVASDLATAVSNFATDDQTFNDYVASAYATMIQNVDAAYTQLKQKYQ
ncbi:Ig-like domain-containing protein [Rouxiella sp. T17]|uniref:Ig-like domain-containing protein n=1 Tax=Rouxiella sp. T17 TaxID=3085684 RepID=UPI002FC7ADD6